jgi:hypothetical protein
MKLVAALLLVLALLPFAPQIADAHFKLLAPQSWLVETNLGDPQKLGPCGGTSADGGMPRSELPADPESVTKDSARGPQSVSAAIDKQPKIPVLADGLFPHTVRMNDPWETDIDIPNINCPKCTLQIVEFMAEHGVNKDGGFFYHHCADLQITADPAKPIDRRWPAAR